jgi:hypothetical protein
VPETPDRDEQAVSDALSRLDGTAEAAVSLLTDVPRDELGAYGGMPQGDED